MRRIVFALLVAVSWAAHAAKPAKPAVPVRVEFGAGAWVDVDATGKAHVVGMDTLRRFKDGGKPGSIADIIKTRLRERIESWAFQPAAKNGSFVRSRSHISVQAEASDDQHGGIELRVVEAHTGSAIADNKAGELARIQSSLWMRTGVLVVDIAYRGDGSVETANVVKSSFDKYVDKRALAVAMTWRISPEVIDGDPISGKGRVPIVICIEDECPADEDADSSELREFTALNPAVQLRTAVAGTIL